MALGTQWRAQIVAGLTKARIVYFGLDYAALEKTAQLRQQPIDPDDFEDLQAMEHAALAVLNKE